MAAPSSATVLLIGESGTGKELIAQAIHLASKRDGNLVKVNCSGIDDFHFTDTLFGHSVGAFTGAQGERQGLIEQARFDSFA